MSLSSSQICIMLGHAREIYPALAGLTAEDFMRWPTWRQLVLLHKIALRYPSKLAVAKRTE